MFTPKRIFGCLVTVVLAIIAASAMPGFDPFSWLCLHGNDTHCNYVPLINLLTAGAGVGFFVLAAFKKEKSAASLITGSALIGLFTYWQLLANWPWYMEINWTILFIFFVLPIVLVATCLFTGASLVRRSLDKGSYWWILTALWALGVVFAMGRLTVSESNFLSALLSTYLMFLSLNGSVIWTVYRVLRWFFKKEEEQYRN